METYVMHISGEKNRFILIEGDFKAGIRKYPCIDREKTRGEPLPVFGYGFDGQTTVGNIIEDISDEGDEIIILTDEKAYGHLKGFDNYRGRKVTVKSPGIDARDRAIARSRAEERYERAKELNSSRKF